MENRAYALAAGFFVLFLSLAAAAGIWWFGDRDEPMSDYLVVTRGNVTGLNPEAAVRYRGILVGKVVDLRLDGGDPRNILIQIRVHRSVPITTATRAKLAYQGVTGIGHILLEENGGDALPLAGVDGGLPRIVMEASFLDRLGDAGGNIIQQAGELLVRLQDVLDDTNQQHIRQLLGNLERATSQLVVVGESLAPALDASTNLMQQGGELLNAENVGRVERGLDGFERAVNSADRVFERWERLSDDWSQLATRLDALSERAAGNEGLAGLMTRINRLAVDIERSNNQLSRVLQTIEETPNAVVVGAPVVSPGPGEAGFRAPPVRATAGSKTP